MGRKKKFQTEEEHRAHHNELIRIYMHRSGRRKGKYPDYSGEHANGAKLNRKKVLEMRRLRREGWTLRRLAEKYGVHASTVWNAVNGRTYKDTPDLPSGLYEKICEETLRFVKNHGPLDEVKARVMLKNIKKLLPKT
jgi:hypothetical protein